MKSNRFKWKGDINQVEMEISIKIRSHFRKHIGHVEESVPILHKQLLNVIIYFLLLYGGEGVVAGHCDCGRFGHDEVS